MAKLTTKKRKRLPDSAFCGPNRSFPAHDCSHVKAGLSLLGRYKGPGSKASIRACLYRKAKKMNCFKSDSIAMAETSVLIELVKMYEDDAIGFADIASLVSEMCNGKVLPKDMSNILVMMEKGYVERGFSLLNKLLAG